MEYQKMTNLLDNTSNQPSTFRTKNWVETNDYVHGTCNTNTQIKFKTSMLKSSLCDYSDAYILMSGAITVPKTGAAGNPNNRKIMMIKNCNPFTDCIGGIKYTQLDNAKDNDIVMPIYNLIEYNDNYPKTSGWLWQYYTDKPFLDDNDGIADFQCFV